MVKLSREKLEGCFTSLGNWGKSLVRCRGSARDVALEFGTVRTVLEFIAQDMNFLGIVTTA